MKDYAERYNAIPIIFKDLVHSGSLFHYTSITGFLLMMGNVRDKKCYLFPGHLRYQNDMHELSEGIDYVKNNSKVLKRQELSEELNTVIQGLNNNIYISCFSANRDLLEQWKYYGSNCGLSIEFNFDECECFFDEEKIPKLSTPSYHYHTANSKNTSKCQQDGAEVSFGDKTLNITRTTCGFTRTGISLTPIDVLYDESDKLNVLNDIINENFDKNMDNLSLYNTLVNQKQYIQCAISAFIPICKNHYFEHEQESRLIFFPLDDSKIMYREKNNRILPYLKCTIVNKDANKYPVKSVTVGPGHNQNLVFNAVINMIDSDNSRFFSEEECLAVLNSSPDYKNEELLKQNISHGELAYYKNSVQEKVLVYCTQSGLLIYKSPIPFRD